MRTNKFLLILFLVVAVLGVLGVLGTGVDLEQILSGTTTEVREAPVPAPAMAPISAEERAELILSAPPRDTAAEGMRRFGPVAAYLTQVLGRRVVYRHPGSWGGYQTDMQQGIYDLVFDGPHFVSWRIENSHHNVLVKVPGDFVYTASVRSDEPELTSIEQLVGHKVCAHSTPNLGTLILLQEFPDPARQPSIIITHGYDHIYEDLLAGKCDAAMLPLKHWRGFEQNSGRTRVIFQNDPLPQQALTAGPRLTPVEQEKVREAFLSWESREATAVMRTAYAGGREFVAARNDEYIGIARYLQGEQGW
jgi:ABC-type phosphate/phosphonate transport system substrate-binding protein